jgi:N-acetyl sugar amidotransferase
MSYVNMQSSQAREYRICSRCVMDTTDPDIEFDAQGVCNHCHRHDSKASAVPLRQPDAEALLQNVVAKMKASKRGKYDAIMGLSGGVDSSYAALLAKKLGLNPLAIHFDNGWNSELAVKNIEHIVTKLGIDLETYVIDWEEFRDLQRSFFKANVIDIELITDQAILASMYRLAASHGIRYIISGTNVATESVMPRTWLHMKSDLRNLKAIHQRFGTTPLKSFPTLSIWQMAYYRYLRGIHSVSLLNYVPYRKADAMQAMERELGWKYYGGKHYESQFTKFYQAHILPVKFGVDKRRCHLSNLILNGEMTRDEALKALEAPLYDASELERDRTYVLKKLGFTRAEFDEYLAAPPIAHDHYPSHARFAERLLKLRSALGS